VSELTRKMQANQAAAVNAPVSASVSYWTRLGARH
jgi:hypothetical protein